MTPNHVIGDWLADFQQKIDDGKRRPRTFEAYTDIYESHLHSQVGLRDILLAYIHCRPRSYLYIFLNECTTLVIPQVHPAHSRLAG
ncbi:hypothetical protein MnBA_12130 [Marinobacterium sp. BA1]